MIWVADRSATVIVEAAPPVNVNNRTTLVELISAVTEWGVVSIEPVVTDSAATTAEVKGSPVIVTFPAASVPFEASTIFRSKNTLFPILV